MEISLEHVGLPATDPVALKNWYERVLGARTIWDSGETPPAYLIAFPGGGWLKVAYFTILFSHMVLAVATVPLVLRTLYLARAARFVEHRKIARITFPIWMYVSVTGVLVYVLLYQPTWHL